MKVKQHGHHKHKPALKTAVQKDQEKMAKSRCKINNASDNKKKRAMKKADNQKIKGKRKRQNDNSDDVPPSKLRKTTNDLNNKANNKVKGNSNEI